MDYLHLLVTIMNVLCRLYKIPARLLLTIHDEVRYLAPVSHQYRAAFVLQLANFWTRAYFSYRLGITDLPLSVAFFSGVDFDKVLRKDPNQTCRTITSPVDIPPGVTLDLHQLVGKLEDEPHIEESMDPKVVADLKAARLIVRQRVTNEQTVIEDLPQEKKLHRVIAQFDRDAAIKFKRTSHVQHKASPASRKRSDPTKMTDGPNEWNGLTNGIDQSHHSTGEPKR